MKKNVSNFLIVCIFGLLLANPNRVLSDTDIPSPQSELKERKKSAESAAHVKQLIERFVNSRTAGSIDDFLVAVDMIRQRAREGHTFFRYLLAIYAPLEPLCRLTE